MPWKPTRRSAGVVGLAVAVGMLAASHGSGGVTASIGTLWYHVDEVLSAPAAAQATQFKRRSADGSAATSMVGVGVRAWLP